MNRRHPLDTAMRRWPLSYVVLAAVREAIYHRTRPDSSRQRKARRARIDRKQAQRMKVSHAHDPR